jgi:mono/diheme cytochrome c family protein
MPGGLRIAAFVVGGFVALILVVYGSVFALSSRDFNRTYEIDVAPLMVTEGTNGNLTEWGEHLHHIRGCADCHGEDGGGRPFSEDPALGILYASNLTGGEGGAAASYTDEDWARSVRHGVGPDMKPLMFMPSHEFWPLSDDDLAALIAFYRGAPAVDNTVPEPDIGPLGRILYVTGQLPLVPAKLVDHDAERPAAPPIGPTVEYGAYLATGCTGCHGPGLSGGRIVGGDPNWPPAKNITPDQATGIGSWSFEGFDRAMREGIRPDGSEINPVMPIQATSHLTAVEMEAIYNYLMSLEPRPFGNR